MNSKLFMSLAALAAIVQLNTLPVYAGEFDPEPCALCAEHDAHQDTHAAAPISVMKDHTHGKGKVMMSYRYMRMDMDGNQIGTSDVSPETIVTTVPNRFFGMAGQPATLRVVPTSMSMDMHMLGAMVGVTDNLTLMGMLNYVEKDMDHITFQGGAGTTRLGTFSTHTSGLSDTTVTALTTLMQNEERSVVGSLGISLPTGSITETGQILTPMNMRPTVRLPYSMQLGSGTFDFLPSLTYKENHDKWSYGLQYSGVIRTGRNDEDYTWGDKHQINAWTGYAFNQNWSATALVSFEHEGTIDGIDSSIALPVQTADPDNYGGKRLKLGLGAAYKFNESFLEKTSIAADISIPIYQDLNGPQMEQDYTFTIGLKKGF